MMKMRKYNPRGTTSQSLPLETMNGRQNDRGVSEAMIGGASAEKDAINMTNVINLNTVEDRSRRWTATGNALQTTQTMEEADMGQGHFAKSTSEWKRWP